MQKAQKAATEIRDDDIPPYLINPSYLSKEGKQKSAEYKYPHDYGGYVEQEYLPKKVRGQVFYEPTDFGFEKDIKAIRVKKGKK